MNVFEFYICLRSIRLNSCVRELTLVSRLQKFIISVGGALLLMLSTIVHSQSEVESKLVLGDSARAPHITVSLISEMTHLRPGETNYIGVLLEPDPEWHTYWRNPGDSGEPPVINMSANADIEFGEIQWPIPQAIPIAHLVNYGYEGANLLMLPVSVSQSLTAQEVSITADLSWLVCKEDCIPGYATLDIELPVGESNSTSQYATLFEQTRGLLPVKQWRAGKFEINQESIVVSVSEFEQARIGTAQVWTLFPFRSDIAQHADAQQVVVDGESLSVIVPRSLYFDGEAENLQWLLSNGVVGFYLDTANNLSAINSDSEPQSLSIAALAVFVGMAFLGGLILNLMPCVLPVLSIKAIGLQNIEQRQSIKFAYLTGVLACFNVFALLIIGLQAGGQQVGWGFQMQEPVVVVLLSFLFTFIALVLFDALDVGSRLAGVGESLISGKGWSSNFFTGVLAVIVASPCTAPFMAAALGVALVSEPLVTLLLFNALAVGFALPLTLMYLSPRLKNILPKPGNWMVTFKRVLAFPMLATVAWLCWVYAGQTSSQAQFGLLIALLVFSMCLWLLGQLDTFAARGAAAFVALCSIAVPIYLGATSLTSGNSQQVVADHVKSYSQALLDELKSDNTVVVVNMTADWCITCKVNEHVAFSDPQVMALLKSDSVEYVVGDWTNKNQSILNYLKQYERAGVPLYVIYAGDQHVQVLPQILTPTIIINAINQARKELTND